MQAENRGTPLLDWAINNPLPDGSLNATMVLKACGMLEGSLALRKAPKNPSLFKNLVRTEFRIVSVVFLFVLLSDVSFGL